MTTSRASGSEAPVADAPICPPWLRVEFERLIGRHRQSRLPHAILLGGIRGIGKRAFAEALVAALLCESPAERGDACHRCDACAQRRVDSHPDILRLAPEGAGEVLRIDTIRALVDWVQLTASLGRYRLGVVDSADRMNVNASNALLKTLEEPPREARLILIADHAGALPATVRSRCLGLTLRLQDRQAALTWLGERVAEPELALMQAGGAPLLALELDDDDRQRRYRTLIGTWRDLMLHRRSIGRLVDTLADEPLSECLSWIARLVTASCRIRAGLPSGLDADGDAVAQSVADTLSSDDWFALHARIRHLDRIDSSSFRTRAVLDGLFADIRLAIRDQDVA